MVVCSWCGQQSQSDQVCDWCKRPFPKTSSIDLTRAPRTELELLGDEPVDRVSPFKLALVALCVCAGIGLVIFALRIPLGSSEPVAAATEDDTEYTAEREATPSKGNYYNPPRGSVASGPVPDRPRIAGKQTKDSSGRRSTARGATVAGAPLNEKSPVQLKDLIVTVINANGAKQLMGTAIIHNGSDRKVVDYRAEILWGAETYSAKLMTGKPGKLLPLDERVLEPGEDIRCAIVSQPIQRVPPGNPSAITLQAWLDGIPGTTMSQHSIN